MIRTISSEWLKLRSVTSHLVLAMVAVVFPVIVGLLVASFGDMEGGPSSSAEMAEFVTATIFNSRGGDVSITGDRVPAMLSSAVVLAVVVTWFGFGLGLIIRNSPATVSILLLWPLLIETLLIVVINLVGWDSLDQYMPYQGAIIAGGISPDDSSLGRPGAHVYFAAIALALIAIGVLLDERRDA